jgi:transcriptional regulator with XRE-family HTH domain
MSVEKTISAAQCRAGRALIRLTQADLADAASISKSVVVDFENDHRIPNRNNLAAIRRALEGAGVEFINGGSPGVRLRPE